MKFYQKYFKNCYEELLSYYPRYYRDVFEMMEILKAFGRVADGLEDAIEQAYLNYFIQEADLKTIKIWEDILGISYTEDLTLEQRKSVIIGRISGYGHIGEPEIRGVIANYTKKPVTVDFVSGVIVIVIDGAVFDETNLLNTLLQRIPAHLPLNMMIHIKREFRQRLKFSFGGAVGNVIRAQPVGEDRTAVLPVEVSYGSFLASDLEDIPKDIRRASTGPAGRMEGMFCRTHVKSKRIG